MNERSLGVIYVHCVSSSLLGECDTHSGGWWVKDTVSAQTAEIRNVACSRLRQVAASLQSVGNLVFTGENKLFDVSTTQK